MAEMGDIFPRPNLGPGDVWARQVVERIHNLERELTGTSSNLRTVQAGANSALSSIVQQTPIIEQIRVDQSETIAEVEVKGRTFAQPEMPLPPDPRSLWIDTDDDNLAYRGVELVLESDFSDGTTPFTRGSTPVWSVVDGAGRTDGPALVLTGIGGTAYGPDDWDRANHVSYNVWLSFPSIAEENRGGVVFSAGGSDLIAVVMNTLSSGTGLSATLSVSGAAGLVEGGSPFTVEAGVWYNLQVLITGTHVSVVVYDGDGLILTATNVEVPGTPTGGAGVYGYSTSGVDGVRFSDFRASSAEWEAMPNSASEEAQQALEDAQQALNDAANAQATADGKNNIYSGTTDPPGTDYVNGDLFFEQDANGDVRAIKIWNGTAWVDYTLVANEILVPGSVGAIQIADGAITTPKLFAGSVTADTIAADAIVSDKIAAGAIFGEHIAAGTISANKLVISDSTDLIPDSGFNSPIGEVWSTNGYPWTVGFFGQPDSKGAFLSSGFDGTSITLTSGGFSVKTGDRLQVRADLFNSSDANVDIQVSWFDNGGGTISNQTVQTVQPSAPGWEVVSGEVVVPSGAVSARFRLVARNPTTAATTGIRLGGPQVLRKATAELIVDGAITADKLSANAIDGKLITGATIRTADSGARMTMDTGPSLNMYDVNGAWRSSLQMTATGDDPYLFMFDSSETLRARLGSDSLDWMDVNGGITTSINPFGLDLENGGHITFRAVAGDVPGEQVGRLEQSSAAGGLDIFGGADSRGWGNMALNYSSAANEPLFYATSIRDSPTTNSANVFIGSGNGRVYRNTSMKSGKLDVEDVAPNPDILKIPFRSWLDKSELQDSVLYGKPAPDRHIVGVVAEEVQKYAPELCVYNDKGDIQGVQYDRMAASLIPLLRDLTNRVETLEGRALTEWPDSPGYDDTALWDEVTSLGRYEVESEPTIGDEA